MICFLGQGAGLPSLTGAPANPSSPIPSLSWQPWTCFLRAVNKEGVWRKKLSPEFVSPVLWSWCFFTHPQYLSFFSPEKQVNIIHLEPFCFSALGYWKGTGFFHSTDFLLFNWRSDKGYEETFRKNIVLFNPLSRKDQKPLVTLPISQLITLSCAHLPESFELELHYCCDFWVGHIFVKTVFQSFSRNIQVSKIATPGVSMQTCCCKRKIYIYIYKVGSQCIFLSCFFRGFAEL